MTTKHKMRKAYDPSSRDGQIEFKKPSLTIQSESEACDINNIMSRYQATGIIDHVATHAPQYGFVDGATFLEHQQVIARAMTMFNELPAKARMHFEHDPAKFLDYVNNLDVHFTEDQTLQDLGLVEQKMLKTLDEPTPDQPGAAAAAPTGDPSAETAPETPS